MTEIIPPSDELDRIIDQIENEEWSVEDWNVNVGAYEGASVSLQLEYTPNTGSPQTIEELEDGELSIQGIIETLAEHSEDGAPVDAVIAAVTDRTELEPSRVEHEIEKLKQRGEVYEPATDCLRAT